MLAIGIGVITAAVFKAVLKVALLLGGAFALTAYVSLPTFVDVLIWLAAGGYSVLILIGTFTILAALAAAGSRRF